MIAAGSLPFPAFPRFKPESLAGQEFPQPWQGGGLPAAQFRQYAVNHFVQPVGRGCP